MIEIWPEPRILVVAGDSLEQPHDVLDVDVHVEANGREWVATFVTLTRLDELMRVHEKTGENSSGLYEWMSGMIVVRQISHATIRSVVFDLVASGHLSRAFEPAGDDGGSPPFDVDIGDAGSSEREYVEQLAEGLWTALDPVGDRTDPWCRVSVKSVRWRLSGPSSLVETVLEVSGSAAELVGYRTPLPPPQSAEGVLDPVDWARQATRDLELKLGTFLKDRDGLRARREIDWQA